MTLPTYITTVCLSLPLSFRNQYLCSDTSDIHKKPLEGIKPKWKTPEQRQQKSEARPDKTSSMKNLKMSLLRRLSHTIILSAFSLTKRRKYRQDIR